MYQRIMEDAAITEDDQAILQAFIVGTENARGTCKVRQCKNEVVKDMIVSGLAVYCGRLEKPMVLAAEVKHLVEVGRDHVMESVDCSFCKVVSRQVKGIMKYVNLLCFLSVEVIRHTEDGKNSKRSKRPVFVDPWMAIRLKDNEVAKYKAIPHLHVRDTWVSTAIQPLVSK